MPLTKRAVSPVLASQHRLPNDMRQNELECVCNGTLANVVRQMSSLSKHAENIFGELYHEAMKIEHKTNTFASRIERIAAKVTQLDSAVEEVSLQDLHLRKPFKSSSLIDQQSLSRQTMPAAMAECYTGCDRPPDLDKLNVYRTDGKQGLKFYTDPDYFFELWRQEMLKDTDQARKTKNLNNSKTSHGSGEKKHRSKHKQHQQSSNDVKQRRTMATATAAPASSYGSYDVVSHYPNAVGAAAVPVHKPSDDQRRAAAVADVAHNGRVLQAEPAAANGYGGYAAGAGGGQRRPHAELSAINSDRFSRGGSTVYGSPLYDAPPPQITMSPDGGGTTANYRAINIRRTDYSALESIARPPAAASADALVASNGGGRQDSMSPDQASLADSVGGHSKSSSGSRPHRPPPAPPVMENGAAAVFDDVYSLIVKQGREMTLSPPPPLLPPVFTQDDADRSASPDLPPPPPPLFADEGVVGRSPMTVLPTYCAAPPPPAPPPPPPVVDWVATSAVARPPAPVTSNFNPPHRTVKSPTGGQTAATRPAPAAPAVCDVRSDLLRAIRDGIQLKKVDRMAERQREQAAITKGHDVAAILRKRMEDVMGPTTAADQESDSDDNDGSGSDFKDEWDD